MAQENWVVSMVTLISIVFFAIYFRGRGILNFIPILLGIIVGCIIGIPYNLISSSGIQKAPWIQLPVFSLPHFDSPRIIEAILGISVVLLATAPESTAHLHQISLYVDQLAEKIGRDPYRLNRFVGWNLVLDGIGDVINGLIGGIGGTNYGENSSLMAVTNCYSGPVIILSGLIVVLLGFLGKLAAIVQMVPVPVLGGLSIYLFGVIGMQGIAILQEAKVDLFDPRQLGLGAIVCTIGLGGYLHGDGNLEIFISSGFPNGVPSITIAAMIGILLHQVFQWIDKS
jgi:uracil permease